jgi:MFS family permease
MTVSLIGTNMRVVGVPWLVFQLTNSSVAVGLVGLAEVVPLLFFSFVAGAVVDRVERKRLIARMQLGVMFTVGLLALLATVDRPPLLAIYGLTAVASALSAIERPARTAMLPQLVPAGKLPAAFALRQLSFQTTLIFGPALAGLVIASVGVVWVFVFDALSYLASLFVLRWLPRSIPERTQGQSPVDSLKEGLSFAFRTPLIWSIFLIDLIAMIFGMPRAVFPALAAHTFDIGAKGVGLLYAAPSVGAVIGALTTGWVGRINRQGVAVLISVGIWGLAIALAGFSVFSLALTLFFLALAGAADAISAVFRGSMLVQETPADLWGRVSSVNLMVVAGGPLVGDFEAGLAAGALGPPGSVVLGGLACLVGTAIVAARSPLRTYVKAAN